MRPSRGLVYPAFAIAADFTVLLVAGAAASEWPHEIQPGVLLGVAALTTALTAMSAPRGVLASIALADLFVSSFSSAPYGELKLTSPYSQKAGLLLLVIGVVSTITGWLYRRSS